MPFSQATFLGCSVRSVDLQLGYGIGQQSQLSVQLVEDPANGDAYTNPEPGTPVTFSLGGVQWAGLHQKVQRRRGPDGNPLLDVVAVDPREILDGTQVIVGGYLGAVPSPLRNVLNAYGWWENQGYGASLANDNGMPWTRVRQAVLALTSSPSVTDFGGPLTYKGIAYSLDLSQLPPVPDHYRVGGFHASLLEMIAQVCEDGAHDFFVELSGFTIRIRTVSRKQAPPLGTIQALVDSGYGVDVSASSVGLEARNETTSFLLLGGDVQQLYLTTSGALKTYWGLDVSGRPILGVPDVLALDVGVEVASDTFTLNAEPVADILGSTLYDCSELELRLAKVNFGSWATYLAGFRSGVAEYVGITSPFKDKVGINALFKGDVLNDERANAIKAIQDDLYDKQMRMYQFVKGYADEYLGRKFATALPNVLFKQDPESLRVSFSYEVSDGGYLPESSTPLGLNYFQEDTFRTSDGLFAAFVRYDSIESGDFSRVPPEGTVIQSGSLFSRCTVDRQFYFTDPSGFFLGSSGVSPYVVLTVPGPFTEQARDGFGDHTIVAALLQTTPEKARQILNKGAFGNVGIKIAPAHYKPTQAAIPLKSNILTYGPWFKAGNPGKTRVEVDPGLTPWNYGGHEFMNLAASARVYEVASAMQVSEAGSVTRVGLPEVSLGDVLQAGGPVVTNISISYGPQGVTTTYYFQSFTPRFGTFSKQNAERLKRSALLGVEVRKSQRALANARSLSAEAQAAARRTQMAFHEEAPAFIKRQSPHDALVGYSASGGRVGVSSLTAEEMLAFTNASGTEWRQTSIGDWAGLLQPFSTGPTGMYMPGFVTPFATGENVVNLTMLNRFTGQRPGYGEYLAWGASYSGVCTYTRDVDWQNVRTLALQAPLVLAGWGMDTEGTLRGTNGPATYKAGPLDALWDEKRGVWTCHGTLRGTISGVLEPGTQGYLIVKTRDNHQSWGHPVTNWGNAVASGDMVAHYSPCDNAFYVEGQGTGGGGGTGGGSTFSGARVYHDADQNFPSLPDALLVEFNSERFDVGNYHSTIANNSRLTVPASGYYQVGFHGTVYTNDPFTTEHSCVIRLNGNTRVATEFRNSVGGQNAWSFNLSALWQCASGDYFETLLTSNGSDAVLVSGTGGLLSGEASNYYDSPEFWIYKVG